MPDVRPAANEQVDDDRALTGRHTPYLSARGVNAQGDGEAIGRNATNGWARMKSRATALSRRSPHPMIVVLSRTRCGCSRRN
jgi:hypothetical protein